MELYKAFYWPGGPHPAGGVRFNYKPGWYWLAKHLSHNGGGVYLAAQQRYDPKTNQHDWILTRKAAVRGAHYAANTEHWAKIWHAAYDNMPYRIKRIPEWVNCEPGTTKLTDFIAGEVRGKYRMNYDGNVVQKIVYRESQYGRICALARCMRFILSRDGRTPNHNWVINSMGGAKPRDPAKRARLVELAGENGKQKAYEILTELKIRHWYV